MTTQLFTLFLGVLAFGCGDCAAVYLSRSCRRHARRMGVSALGFYGSLR
jgi:hypothetical protein